VAREVDVVAACSDRKRVTPLAEVRLRAVGGDRTRARLESWRDRVEAAPRVVSARDLYAGAHWAAVLDGVEALRRSGWIARLWVASAGLGIVAEHERVPSYSATFGAGHADSVWRGSGDGPRLAALRDWWRALTEEKVEPFASSPHIIFVAGQTYVDAVQPLLVRGGVRGRTVVLSTSSAATVRYDGRARVALGGTLGSLNARVFRHLSGRADAHGWRPDALQDAVDLLARGAPEPGWNRLRLDDGAISEWIVSLLTRAPHTRRTEALRALRDAGVACSQARFAGLYQSVENTVA
jgi:hypothetical protein